MRGLFHVLAGLVLSAALYAAPALVERAAADTPGCQDASTCGTLLSGDCLQRFGAGAMPVTDPGDACSAEFAAYRQCLVEIVSACAEQEPAAGSLRVGAAPDLNAQLQRELKRIGDYEGAVDGEWGPETRAAMRAFQRREGFSVDGNGYPEMLVEAKLRRPYDPSRMRYMDTLGDDAGGVWELTYNRPGYQCIDFLEITRSGSILIVKGATDRKTFLPLEIEGPKLDLFRANSSESFSMEPLAFSIVNGKLTMLDESHDFGVNDQCVYERQRVYEYRRRREAQ
ncbi:MAG: peptidoglycan-binding domain-containing protein [Pseudomonadota bacterium]